MNAVLKSPVFAGLVGGISFLATLFFVLASTSLAEPEKTNASAAPEVNLWSTHNYEVDQLVSELKKEREALRSREAGLNKLAEQLKLERAELDDIARDVKAMQAQFDKNIVQVKADEQSNLKKQAKMYASMAPESAAQILAEMEDSAVVKLLGSMKEEESASILEGLLKRNPQAAKRAATLSEQLRKMLMEKSEQK